MTRPAPPTASHEVFLLGGGWNARAVRSTYGRFLAAAGPAPRVACVVLDEPGCEQYASRFAEVLGQAGARDVAPVFVGRRGGLSLQQLAGADAVFVAGGLTPAYLAALSEVVTTLRPWLWTHGVPYAGFSAGAAVAAARAVVGGWKMRGPAGRITVCPEEVAENLDRVTVAPGLGLVSFSVDVHAAAWGTLSRLVSVVEAGLVCEGWTIDEDTMLHVAGGRVAVHGLGRAYHVRRCEGRAGEVTVTVRGAQVSHHRQTREAPDRSSTSAVTSAAVSATPAANASANASSPS